MTKRFAQFTDEEKEIIYFSLGMKKNILETGDKGMSLEDAARMNKQVRPMTVDQMRNSLKIRGMMEEIYR